MFDTEKQLQRLGQKTVIRKKSSVSAATPRVEKVTRQTRHRSLEGSKKLAKQQSASLIHITVRQPKISESNNNKSANTPQNLLPVRYYFKASNMNFPFVYTVLNNFDQSAPAK